MSGIVDETYSVYTTAYHQRDLMRIYKSTTRTTRTGRETMVYESYSWQTDFELMSFSQILTDTAYSRVPLGNTNSYTFLHTNSYSDRESFKNFQVKFSSKQILKAQCVVPEKKLSP